MVPENWLVGFGSLYTLLSLILVILINAAGTNIISSHKTTEYNTTILNNLHILEVSSYYGANGDIYYSDSGEPAPLPAWSTRFYLNAACATPLMCRGGYCSTLEQAVRGENYTYAETISFWTICHYKTPGHDVDIQATLETMDAILFGNAGVFPNVRQYYPYRPPGNWSFPVEDGYLTPYTIPTKLPFAMWLLGAIASFIYLAGAAAWALYGWRFQRRPVLISSPTWDLHFVGFQLTIWPVLFYMIAIAWIHTRYDAMIKYMGDAKTETANEIYGNHAFLAIGWCLILSQFLGAMFALAQWRRERRHALERLRNPRCDEIEITTPNRRGSDGADAGGDVRAHRVADEDVREPPPPYHSGHEDD